VQDAYGSIARLIHGIHGISSHIDHNSISNDNSKITTNNSNNSGSDQKSKNGLKKDEMSSKQRNKQISNSSQNTFAPPPPPPPPASKPPRDVANKSNILSGGNNLSQDHAQAMRMTDGLRKANLAGNDFRDNDNGRHLKDNTPLLQSQHRQQQQQPHQIPLQRQQQQHQISQEQSLNSTMKNDANYYNVDHNGKGEEGSQGENWLRNSQRWISLLFAAKNGVAEHSVGRDSKGQTTHNGEMFLKDPQKKIGRNEDPARSPRLGSHPLKLALDPDQNVLKTKTRRNSIPSSPSPSPSPLLTSSQSIPPKTILDPNPGFKIQEIPSLLQKIFTHPVAISSSFTDPKAPPAPLLEGEEQGEGSRIKGAGSWIKKTGSWIRQTHLDEESEKKKRSWNGNQAGNLHGGKNDVSKTNKTVNSRNNNRNSDNSNDRRRRNKSPSLSSDEDSPKLKSQGPSPKKEPEIHLFPVGNWKIPLEIKWENPLAFVKWSQPKTAASKLEKEGGKEAGKEMLHHEADKGQSVVGREGLGKKDESKGKQDSEMWEKKGLHHSFSIPFMKDNSNGTIKNNYKNIRDGKSFVSNNSVKDLISRAMAIPITTATVATNAYNNKNNVKSRTLVIDSDADIGKHSSAMGSNNNSTANKSSVPNVKLDLPSSKGFWSLGHSNHGHSITMEKNDAMLNSLIFDRLSAMKKYFEPKNKDNKDVVTNKGNLSNDSSTNSPTKKDVGNGKGDLNQKAFHGFFNVNTSVETVVKSAMNSLVGAMMNSAVKLEINPELKEIVGNQGHRGLGNQEKGHIPTNKSKSDK